MNKPRMKVVDKKQCSKNAEVDKIAWNNDLTSYINSEIKERSKAVKSKEDLTNCKHCNYMCKQSIAIRKQNNSKHNEYNYKHCVEKFKSANELQKHKSEKHGKKKCRNLI